MKLFNIGPGELFLILVLLMIVFGPERLPQLARQVGKAISNLRNFARDIDPELLQDFREITKDFETVRDEVTSLRSDLTEIQRDFSGAARDVTNSLNEVVREAQVSTSLTSDPQAVRATQAATAAAVTAHKPVPSVTGAKAGAASAAQGAVVAGAAAGAIATAATAGSPTASAATSVTTASPSTAAATAVGELEDELIGVPMLLYGPGDGAFLDEIVGLKVFPLPRSAAHPPVAEPDGHGDQVAIRSRHAVMTSLARRQSPPRPIPSSRTITVRQRTPAVARERMARRG